MYATFIFWDAPWRESSLPVWHLRRRVYFQNPLLGLLQLQNFQLLNQPWWSIWKTSVISHVENEDVQKWLWEWHNSICYCQCPFDIDYYVLYYLADKVHIGSGWTVISCIISAKNRREKSACQLLDKWLLLSEPVSLHWGRQGKENLERELADKHELTVITWRGPSRNSLRSYIFREYTRGSSHCAVIITPFPVILFASQLN